MSVASARGSWDGCAWGVTPPAALGVDANLPDAGAAVAPQAGEPIAVLTRASIRPYKAASFWRRSPRTERALAEAEGCDLAMGLGEAPLLRQCTFSVWRDMPSMIAFAQSGAHGRAAESAWREGHFSETLFVRMRLLASAGHWPAPAPADGH